MLPIISLPKATTFGDGAFEGATILSSVSLPEATTFGSRAFRICSALSTVDLPKAVKFGYDAFNGCASLTSIDLPKAETFGNTAFLLCGGLTSANLPMAVTFGEDAFGGCTTLTSVNLRNATTFGIFAFTNCPSLMVWKSGSTIPTVASYGPGTPNSGAKIIVPDAAAVAAYDADSAPDGDGLWNGWTIVQNTVPNRVSSVSATATQTADVGDSLSEDLSAVFEDADSDSLTYIVNKDGAGDTAAAASYAYDTTAAGTFVHVFKANDGTADSTDTYTVTLTVNETSEQPNPETGDNRTGVSWIAIFTIAVLAAAAMMLLRWRTSVKKNS